LDAKKAEFANDKSEESNFAEQPASADLSLMFLLISRTLRT